MPRADRCHLCMDWRLLVPVSVASSQPGNVTSHPLAPTCLCIPPLWLLWGQLASPRAICSCGKGLEGEEEDLEALARGCRKQTAAVTWPQMAVSWETVNSKDLQTLKRWWLRAAFQKTDSYMPFLMHGRGNYSWSWVVPWWQAACCLWLKIWPWYNTTINSTGTAGEDFQWSVFTKFVYYKLFLETISFCLAFLISHIASLSITYSCFIVWFGMNEH